ncbi:MAG: 5'/3'-nucleotidase SurE [Acidobacteriota bacterium]
MRILMTNDDGVQAEGIRALAQSLREIAEIYVVAPDRERSGTGHCITVFNPLMVQKVEIPDMADHIWVVDGTPADCVKLGICAIMKEEPPDFVVSGINRGPNLGTDVLYSGTVSAAVEGVILGVPAVAVSLNSYKINEDQSFAARFARAVLRRINQDGIAKDTILNINVPCIERSQIKGLRITRLGSRRYENAFEERQDPRGRTYYWLGGEVIKEEQEKDSDVAAVNDDYISITPIHFDLTDYKLINHFRDLYRDQIDVV